MATRIPETSAPSGEAPTTLRAGALHLPSALMQGITHIAPAVGMVLTLQYITSLAGVTSPLAYLVAFLVVVTLGVSLVQLARHLPSAGGYYTYVSRTVHPRAGFLTSWLYFLYDPTGAAINIAFMGFFFNSTMKAEYDFGFPWWLFFIIAGTAVITVAYLGIEISARTLIVLGVAEMAIVVLLGIFGLFEPGSGGINLSPYNPANALSTNGLYLGVVFSIFAFTGFESVAPLAEETANPRRNLPRAIMGSIFIMGAFYLFTSWALLIGWGTNDVDKLVGTTENPIFVLAKDLWGGAWIIVLLAVINSILAVSVACNNASTRVVYAMARSGSMPRALAHVHPRLKTPVNAITLQAVILFAFGLGLGFWIGPDQEFFMMGTAITLGLVFVYGAGNLGVFRFYRGEHRDEFNPITHLIFPLVSTVALIWVGYKSVAGLHNLHPKDPVDYSIWIVGVWLVVGVVLLAVMARRGQEEWLLRAGEVAAVHDAADPGAHQPEGLTV